VFIEFLSWLPEILYPFFTFVLSGVAVFLVDNLVPVRFKKEISTLLDRIQNVWISFLHGEFVLMVVMGLLTWLLNVILGTPQAVMLGFLAGLLEVVPSLGPILTTIPAAILALIFGSSVFPGLNPWIFMMIVIIGYVLLQAIENQVLVPKILGNAVSLPPLIVLIGVTISGATAGIAGIFLATPIMATGRDLLNYVYEKVIAAPEPEWESPEEDNPSILDRVRVFYGNICWPKRHEGRSKQGAS
jgi:predicted PurR-regulated permease PerM